MQQFEIDEVYTSALKRAIISGQQLIKGYGKDVPLKLILEIHERGGCYDGTTVHPGLSIDDVKALAPNMDINGQKITSDGWCFHEHLETKEECTQRAKDFIRNLRQMSHSK